MNKLKKPIPPNPQLSSAASTTMSRTLTLASAGHTVAATLKTTSFNIQPRTSVEQYWAARALKAESLISARMVHEDEIRMLRTLEETKRAHELGVLRRESETRHSKLERLVLILLASLFTLSVFLIYLLSCSLRQSQHQKKSTLSHFTIPILSPFTSVVEHETSVIGTRSIMLFFMILVILGYVMFRSWIARRA